MVLISNSQEELQQMLLELKEASEKIWLSMNLTKTKILFSEKTSIYVGGNEIERVREYVYLDHQIRLEKENQQAEVNRRIKMTWAATGKLGSVLKIPDIPINLKTKVFNTYVLPVMTYGMETTTLTVKTANKLRTTQRA